jgi:aspartyl-tRNA(Asn)/glutamyl-tRNA(Gln) amidotransferase subunit C
MSISEEEMEKLLQLSKLKSSRETNKVLLDDINAIMDFVEQLRVCDTKGVPPLFHPFDLHQRLREDVVTESSVLDELESIAPAFEEGHYLVPTVIEDIEE